MILMASATEHWWLDVPPRLRDRPVFSQGCCSGHQLYQVAIETSSHILFLDSKPHFSLCSYRLQWHYKIVVIVLFIPGVQCT